MTGVELWNLPGLSTGSNTGPELALGAFGHNACVLYPHSQWGNASHYGSGTSIAAPMVSGVAALMLSANPCLGRKQTLDIMEATAAKGGTNQGVPIDYNWDPNRPGHSKEFGYGLVNANRAVPLAYYMHSQNLDLYIKDDVDDWGLVDPLVIDDLFPDYAPGGDFSPDIWVRNNPDGMTNFEHQNPEYTQGQPVHVYVRVRNKSCVASTGTEVLNLYWSKAANTFSWPQNWDGANPNTGNIIGSVTLPVIQPGKDTIIHFSWGLAVAIANNGWHSCLLARISSTLDPITEYPDQHDMVALNNNVALHNVTIVDLVPGKPRVFINGVQYPYGGFMYFANPLHETKSYGFHFYAPESTDAKNITHEAEVTLKFDEAGWNIFKDALNQPGIKKVREREAVLTKADISLQGINIPADTYLPVYVGFSFLTDSITTNEEYKYIISQSYSQTPAIRLGSETYKVKKYARNPFQADAGGDKLINPQSSATLSAQELSEPAIYNWYDENDSLIYTGKDLTVAPEITSRYTLEVIAGLDGFKDYDNAEVKIRKGFISSLSPNPTTGSAALSLQFQNVSSAYLIVTRSFSNLYANYILSPNTTSYNLDMSGYQSGVYNLILVCDGQIADMKTIEKQ